MLARDFLLTWFVYVAWDVAEAKRLTGAGDESFERDTLIMAALGRATSGVDYVDAVATTPRAHAPADARSSSPTTYC